jgi:hypothetical protein
MKIIWALAAILGFVALAPGSAAAQQRYPLFCRGAGHTGYSYLTGERLLVKFRPGSAAVSAGGIQKGECRWADRAFRPGEPDVFCFDNVQGFEIDWLGSGNVSFRAHRPAGVSQLAKDVITQFNVYNAGGCMRL